MTKLLNTREQTDLRRSLRKDMPPNEHVLWSRLRGKQIDGLKFRRQYGIGPYIVDFCCVEVQLVIELDGFSHTSEEVWEKDQERQRFIESLGLTVLRFTNRDVQTDLDAVIEQIWAVAERVRGGWSELNLPPPNLLFRKGGGARYLRGLVCSSPLRRGTRALASRGFFRCLRL